MIHPSPYPLPADGARVKRSAIHMTNRYLLYKGGELTSKARRAGRLEEFDEAVTRSGFPHLAEILLNANMAEDDVYLILFDIGQALNKPLDEMIADRFSGEEAELAKRALADLSRDAGLRILKCAAHYSRGDLNRLDETVKVARLDHRDVMVMGEYEMIRGKLVRIASFG
jgi:hypothetical protein